MPGSTPSLKTSLGRFRQVVGLFLPWLDPAQAVHPGAFWGTSAQHLTSLIKTTERPATAPRSRSPLLRVISFVACEQALQGRQLGQVRTKEANAAYAILAAEFEKA